MEAASTVSKKFYIHSIAEAEKVLRRRLRLRRAKREKREKREAKRGKKFSFENHFTELLDKMEAIPGDAKEVFLWELVLSAKIALREIRLESLVDETKLDRERHLFTEIVIDKEDGSLSIIDSGIGMTEADLCRLCTFPEPLLKEMKDNIDKYLTNGDLSCLYSGKCDVGLGFYAAFMVAHKVVITTKQNGHDQCVWESKASERFFKVASHSCGGRLSRGTKVTLFLKDEHLEYLDFGRLKHLVAMYTNTDLCPYPFYISAICRKLHLSFCKRMMKIVRIVDHEKDLKELQQEFEGLRKLFVKVLDDRVQRVVVHDRVYDLPCNLSADRKTLEINPRSPLMKKLRSDAEINLEDEDVEGMINLQYVVGVANIRLYDVKYGTDNLRFELPSSLAPSMEQRIYDFEADDVGYAIIIT